MNTREAHRPEVDAWTIVVPVKALDRAKGRLAPDLPVAARRALALAMATDVVRTCRSTPGVNRVVLLSADPAIASLAVTENVDALTDPSDPPRPGIDPLNHALSAALSLISGPVGVVAADLPELRPGHLSPILRMASLHRHSIVADHRQYGTTMAFWTTDHDRVARFGAGSAERFRDQGLAVQLPATAEAAGRDVDTPADVRALRSRTVGQATTRVLEDHVGPVPAPDAGASATMVR